MFAAVRRVGLGVAVAAALVTTGCAAGQQASTANELPTLDGVNGSVGPINLRGLQIEAPSGNLVSWPAGSDVLVRLVLVNNSQRPDRLVSISSPAFRDWGAYETTADAGQVVAADTATPTPTPTRTPTATLPSPSRSVMIAPGSRVGWGTPESSGALLLRNTTQVLFPGTTIRITFTFARAGTVTLITPIALTDGTNTSEIPTPADGTTVEG